MDALPTHMTSLVGVLMPMAMLLLVWRTQNILYFATLCAFGLFMSSIGMGKLLPIFGWSVVGGSFYFPFVVIVYAMAVKRFGVRRAYKLLCALLLGQLFLILGSARWLVFALYGGDIQTHVYTDTVELTTNSVIILMMFYLSATVVLLCQRLNWRKESKVGIPIIIDVLLTTPFAVWASIRSNPEMALNAYELAVTTVVLRMVLPVMFLVLLHFTEDNDEANARRRDDREYVRAPTQ